MRTPPQEILDIPLVLIRLPHRAKDRVEPHVLAQLDDGFPRGVAIDEAGGLELAVVEAAAEAELAEHLRRDVDAEPAQHAGGDAGAPWREHRHVRLAEQAGHFAQGEHAVGSHVVDAEHVRAAQNRYDRVRVLLGEFRHRSFRVQDVALDRRVGRMRTAHLLREERWVVLRGAVEVRRGLEHELAYRRFRAAARGQDVHGPDHVVLVGEARTRGRGVDDEPRVDHGVDLCRLHDAPEQRVLGAHAHEFGALELARGVLGVDADDHLHVWIRLERLGEAAAPVGGETGDEYALAGSHPNHTELRFSSMSKRFSWIRVRMSWATVWTRLVSASRPD